MFADDLKQSIYSEYVFGKRCKMGNSDSIENLVKQLLDVNKSIGKKSSIFLKDETGWYTQKKHIKEYIEIEFDIPEYWGITTLDSIAYIRTGNSINENVKKKKYTNVVNGYPYIGTKDVSFEKTVNYDNGVRIPKTENFEIAEPNTILLCIEGGSAGRKLAVTNQKIAFGNKLAAFSTNLINHKYIYYFLQTTEFKEIFQTSKSGIIGGVGINKIRSFYIPLPPLAEQDFIVNKLELLESRLEKLAVLNKKDNDLNINFLSQLQNSILLTAIQGNVPLLLNNYSYSSSLDEFNNYRLSLHKKVSSIQKNINGDYIEKTDKKEIVLNEEIPFEIPDNWVYVRLNDVIQLLSGRDLTKDQYNDRGKGIPYITGASNFNDGDIIINRWTSSPAVISKKGDLLITVKGTIGDMAFNDIGNIHIARQVMAVRTDFINYDYLKMVLKYYVFELQSKAKSLIPGISRKDILNLLIPLPPKKEQQGIIDKYNNIYDLLSKYQLKYNEI